MGSHHSEGNMHTLVLLGLLLGVMVCEGVITSQGMGRWGGNGGLEDEEEVEEVRVFTGWLHGGEGDYFMTLQDLLNQRKKQEASTNNNKLSLFTPGVRPNYSGARGSNRDSLKNLTYHQRSETGLPKFVMGMYILLADDTEPGFHTDNAEWEPLLHPYQQAGSNVLFFTFINPSTMDVPAAFQKLAATRGTNKDGAVPQDTLIIFAIGGYAYSIKPNPWDWLTSKEKAEAMAERVATWKDLYKIDGIDLDLEEGAGSQKAAGPNMIHFVRKLKSLQPDLLVSQPTYGYPQIAAEIDVINASWNKGGTSNGLADSIGLMVYEGTQALQYVKNYAGGASMWQGFPIKVDVPKDKILLGCKGASSSNTITKLGKEAVKKDLLGVMVWFCSVRNGLVYSQGWDCSDSEDSMAAYVRVMQHFNQNM